VSPDRRLRALVVDDDPDHRYLIATLLKHDGYEVTTAEDGFHALEQLAAETPDIVVLDLIIPIINGLDVLTEIRQQSPETPVVIVSGAPNAREHAQALGANAVVAKPFDIAELLATVAAAAALPMTAAQQTQRSAGAEQ
jgi:CheY-like chemotaxis protein